MITIEPTDLSTPLTSSIATPASALQSVFLLPVVYLIFITQYGALSVMSPFFPTSGPGRAIGERMVGVVFACYPLGTVCATSLPPLAMRRMGARAAVGLGLLLNGASLLAFGAAPELAAWCTFLIF